MIGAGLGVLAGILFMGAGFKRNARLCELMNELARVAAHLGALTLFAGTIEASSTFSQALKIVAFGFVVAGLVALASILWLSKLLGLLPRNQEDTVDERPKDEEDVEVGADGAEAHEGVAVHGQEAQVEQHEGRAVDGDVAQPLPERSKRP